MKDFEMREATLLRYTGKGGSVTLPEGIEEISPEAFLEREDIIALHFPKSLRRMGDFACKGCLGLTELRLPQGLLTLGSGVFENCANLKSVYLPCSIREFGGPAFYGVPEVKLYTPLGSRAQGYAIHWGVPAIDSGEELFEVEEGVLLKYHGTKAHVVVPQGIHTIGYGAFLLHTDKGLKKLRPEEAYSNRGILTADNRLGTTLQTVKLPASLRRIEAQAFRFCSSLSSVELAPGVERIGEEAFINCEALETLSMGEGLQEIADSAFFQCSSLRELELPQGLLTIGMDAFGLCKNLRRVVLPASLREVGESAFWACSSLEEVVLPGGEILSEGDLFPDARDVLIRTVPGSPAWEKAQELGYRVSAL